MRSEIRSLTSLAGLLLLDLRQIPNDIPYPFLDNILWIAGQI